MRSRRTLPRNGGFTLVEVLVAVLVLTVGVLGTVALVDAANRQSARTLGEEAGTNLARELTEVARRVPFADLGAGGTAAAALHALVPASGPLAGAGWEVVRRGRTYAVAVDACLLEAEGAGACSPAPPPPGSGGGGGGDPAVVVDVLGLLGLDLQGGVPNSLCGVFGPDFDLAVLGVAGVDADACATAGAQAGLPTDPPRIARVAVTVSWDDGGRPRSVSQAALIPDPATQAPVL